MRKTLLNEFSLEIGAGLGPLAGKIWRFGLMGYSCRPDNVMLCLSALGSVLSDMGLPVHVGDAEAAAHGAYAPMHAKAAQRKKRAGVDTLTHALSGALLAPARPNPKDAPPRSLPRRIAAGFFACAAPDLDFVVGFFGPVDVPRPAPRRHALADPAAAVGAAVLLDPGEDPARAARLARALRRHGDGHRRCTSPAT